MKNVIVVIGAGSIGQAIARRVSAGYRRMIGASAAGRAGYHFNYIPTT
jgi:predicted dinucleotide-binding enzyme